MATDRSTAPRVNVASIFVAARYSAAGLGIAFMALSWGLIWSATSTYSSHFCGWPARITCESAQVWWLVPFGVSLVLLAGSVLLVQWARSALPRGLLGLADAAWVVGWLPLILSDPRIRTFDSNDLVRFGIYGGIGIELMRASALAAFPDRRRIVHVVAFVAWAVFLVTLTALPSILQHVAATSA